MKKLLFISLLFLSASSFAQPYGYYGYRGNWGGYPQPCCGYNYNVSPWAVGTAMMVGAAIGATYSQPNIYTVSPMYVSPVAPGYYVNTVTPGRPVVISNPYQPVVIRTY